VAINGTAVPPVPTLAAAQVERGAAVYAEYCAECHGAELQGVPDWKQPLADGTFLPPPHDNTGHSWHHSDAVLLQIIIEGGDHLRGSRMPAFGDQLPPADIRAVLEFIKSHWGASEREFQWWMTATNTDLDAVR
jgi:mono/diheme cytochrome c family protein